MRENWLDYADLVRELCIAAIEKRATQRRVHPLAGRRDPQIAASGAAEKVRELDSTAAWLLNTRRIHTGCLTSVLPFKTDRSLATRSALSRQIGRFPALLFDLLAFFAPVITSTPAVAPRANCLRRAVQTAPRDRLPMRIISSPADNLFPPLTLARRACFVRASRAAPLCQFRICR